MTTTTKTVGSAPGADYATIALWFADRKNQVVAGDIEECVLLDGNHSWNSNQNTWNDVGHLTIRFKGQTPQDGDWDTGATMDIDGALSFKRTNDLTVEFSDICMVNTSGSYSNMKLETNTPTQERDVVFDYSRVMISIHMNQPFMRFKGCAGVQYINMTNCVFENNKTTNASGIILGHDDNEPSDYRLNFKSCTFHRARIEAYKTLTATDQKSQLDMTGCIIEVNPIFYSGKFIQFATGDGAYGGGNSVDNITNETQAAHEAWATTSINNTTFGVTINNDGSTPSSGEVSFQGGTGVKDDYRLVDDSNNLAIDYITESLSTVPTTDILAKSRFRLPDAGAFEVPEVFNLSWQLHCDGFIHHKMDAHHTEFFSAAPTSNVAATSSNHLVRKGEMDAAIASGGGGGGSGGDLGYTAAATNGTVTNTGGTDATLPAATTTNAGLLTGADKTKLDGVESLADVTDTANVTSAGAVMDSELTDEAAVKAIDQGLATGDDVEFSKITTSAVGSIVPFYFANQAAFPSPTTYHGAVAHSHADGAMYFAHAGSWVKIADEGSSNTFTDTQTINKDSTTANSLLLESTVNSSADAAPVLALNRNNNAAANGNYLGQIKFTGDSDTGVERVYSEITAKIGDATNTDEDGIIEFMCKRAGANVIVAQLTHDAFKLINSTGLEVAGDIIVTGNVDGRDVAADGTKLDLITVTQAVDLDTLESDVAANNAKVGLTDGSVTTAKLGADAVTGDKIADDAIGSEHIADDAVVSAAIADDAVGSAQIADGAVDTARLGADAVTSAKIADDAVGSEHIADDAVGSAAIADDAVGSAQIADGAVDTDRLGADAVTGAKIADDAVGSEHISDDAVVAAAIADGAVDAARLATNAVSTVKIANDAVTNAKMADNAVTTAVIRDSSVTTAKLATGAVNAEAIGNGAVETSAIADDAVTAGKINDGAVTTAKLATGAVNAEAISNGAVETSAIADGSITSAKLADTVIVRADRQVGDPYASLSTTSLTEYYSLTIPGGTLANRTVRVHAHGTMKNNSGGTQNFQHVVRLGGVDMHEAAGSIANDADQIVWIMRMDLSFRAAGAQFLSGEWRVSSASTASDGISNVFGMHRDGTWGNNAVAQTDSGDLALTFAQRWQTSTTNSEFKVYAINVEYV